MYMNAALVSLLAWFWADGQIKQSLFAVTLKLM